MVSVNFDQGVEGGKGLKERQEEGDEFRSSETETQRQREMSTNIDV